MRTFFTPARFIVAVTGLAAGGFLAVVPPACVPNPNIDGSKVLPIGTDADVPACPAVCQRLAALCGYAPVDCETQCDADYGPDQRLCVGQATNCRAALQDCAPAEEEDAGEDGESNEDGGDDGGEVDGETVDDGGADAPDDSGPELDAAADG
jgi:hypothetical protein